MKTAPRLPRQQGSWRVGELAALTGLTVRTLHHYEAIGLLAPSERTVSGHRLYDDSSVERLYRVRALRSLGVSLAAVRLLIDDGSAVTVVLRDHLKHVEGEVERLTELRDRLRRLCRLSSGSPPDSRDLLKTITLTAHLHRHADARRAERGAGSGTEHVWRTLGQELRRCLLAGEKPTAPRPQSVGRRARQLMRAFAAGDAGVLEALDHLRTTDPPANLAGWTPELFEYLTRVLRALGRGEHDHAE